MHDDGDIEYSRYSLSELEEALAGINRHKYPKNYANLRSAYEQITRSSIAAAAPVLADEPNEARPKSDLWGRFWSSRPIRALMGAVCLWWSFDLFTQTDCPVGKRLTGAIIQMICENLGHQVAAGVPFVIGAALIIYAAFPKRRAEA
jgi:hypothetical protein